MTQEEAFIQAIREAPNDDAPRLIYADWLEEHGQSGRADLIRVQCLLAQTPKSSREHSLLMAHTETLLRANWEEWISPLRETVGPWRDRYGEGWMGEEYHPQALRRFHRGFICGISLAADSFLRQAHKVRYLIPQLNYLYLWGAGQRGQALAASPELQGLRTLGFADYYDAFLMANDAAALATSPYLKGLSSLRLERNSLGDEGVEALVQAPWLVSVTWLDLTDNGLSDRAARALAASSNLVNLRILWLRRNAISRSGIAHLTCSANLRRLERLEYDPPTENGSSVGNRTA
jgi:uncharacterized protein (TIGR02996 family)